jgi:hypothetical protein
MTVIMVIGALACVSLPPLAAALSKAVQSEPNLLADLGVVARIGKRMQSAGNVEAAKAANALIEAALKVTP